MSPYSFLFQRVPKGVSSNIIPLSASSFRIESALAKSRIFLASSLSFMSLSISLDGISSVFANRFRPYDAHDVFDRSKEFPCIN